MSDLAGKTALITGGGLGLGKIMARLLLERGVTVIIWDISQSNIDNTLSELSVKGNIIGFNVDITDQRQVQSAAAKIKKDIGIVDVLINNAGMVVGKLFHEHSGDDITRTIELNTTAHMLVTKAFLPDMMTQNSGHICNIASSAGLVSNPKMSVYAASKWAIVGWSDSLRLEMQQLNKNVNITTILPYYINTGMFDGVKSKLPILDPEAASLTIIKAIETDKMLLTLPGYIYRLTRFGQAVMPIKFFDWFAGSLLGVYTTMIHFTGRKK